MKSSEISLNKTDVNNNCLRLYGYLVHRKFTFSNLQFSMLQQSNKYFYEKVTPSEMNRNFKEPQATFTHCTVLI